VKRVFDFSDSTASSNSPSSPTATAEQSLADLEPGDSAVVVGVRSTDATGRRLQDLGFLPSTRVRAIRRAPLGDPSVYELRGYRLCLRRSEARQVRVRSDDASRAGRA
jgi:ferrous iron transport protein A